jgi:hypothetical protein
VASAVLFATLTTYDYDNQYYVCSGIFTELITAVVSLYGVAAVYYPDKLNWHVQLSLDCWAIAANVGALAVSSRMHDHYRPQTSC